MLPASPSTRGLKHIDKKSCPGAHHFNCKVGLLLAAAYGYALQHMQESESSDSRGALYLRQGHSKLKLCKHSYALGSCCSSSPSPTASVSGLQTARAEAAAAAGGCKLAACKDVHF